LIKHTPPTNRGCGNIEKERPADIYGTTLGRTNIPSSRKTTNLLVRDSGGVIPKEKVHHDRGEKASRKNTDESPGAPGRGIRVTRTKSPFLKGLGKRSSYTQQKDRCDEKVGRESKWGRLNVGNHSTQMKTSITSISHNSHLKLKKKQEPDDRPCNGEGDKRDRTAAQPDRNAGPCLGGQGLRLQPVTTGKKARKKKVSMLGASLTSRGRLH